MKRRILTGVVATATLLASLCFVESGNARRKGLPSTSRLAIDGRSFVSDDSPSTDSSFLKRELGKLGVRLPDGFDLPDESTPSHPLFSGRLKESPPPRSNDTPRLPAGLDPEHTLRMEGEGVPIDLVFGRMGRPGPSIRSRLLSSGWDSVFAGKGAGETYLLQFTQGKETTIVCLDEEEGTFLLLREVGR